MDENKTTVLSKDTTNIKTPRKFEWTKEKRTELWKLLEKTGRSKISVDEIKDKLNLNTTPKLPKLREQITEEFAWLCDVRVGKNKPTPGSLGIKITRLVVSQKSSKNNFEPIKVRKTGGLIVSKKILGDRGKIENQLYNVEVKATGRIILTPCNLGTVGEGEVGSIKSKEDNKFLSEIKRERKEDKMSETQKETTKIKQKNLELLRKTSSGEKEQIYSYDEYQDALSGKIEIPEGHRISING